MIHVVVVTRIFVYFCQFDNVFRNMQTSLRKNKGALVDTRNKLVLDDVAILLPVLSILDCASFKVTATPMNQDDEEEDWVEIWDWGGKSDAKSPRERLEPVCSIVDLASICPPSARQQAVSVFGLDKGGVLDDAPWELRECLAEGRDSLHLHPEATLLGHGCVKDVVRDQELGVECDVCGGAKMVRGRIVRGHIHDRVAVREGDSGKVPEDDHESPLFVEHVPCLRNALLSFGTCVDVQASGKNHESHVSSDVSIFLILLASSRDGDEEEEYPGNADFGPHLEVDITNSGVKRSTHPKVVEKVSRHAELLTLCDGDPVGGKRGSPTPKDGDGHHGSEIVHDFGDSEDVGCVEDSGSRESEVKGGESVAVICQALVVEGWDGETLLFETWCDEREEEFESHETGVD